MNFTKYYQRKGMPDAALIMAVQINQESITEATMLTHGHVAVEVDPETNERSVGLNVAAIDGVKRASTGDYVIRDAAGALHVRKAEAFEEKYAEYPTGANPGAHIDVREMRAKQREARDG